MRSFATVSGLALVLALSLVACGDDGPSGGNLDASSPTTDAAGSPDAAAACGNTAIEGAEECDDGNNDDADECHNDCTLACGDGTMAAFEQCDTGIAAGQAGACPTDCNDDNGCTTDSLDGTSCQTVCTHGTISVPANDDGCCPAGATADTDNDCVAGCGDGVVTAGETCDTAIAAGNLGACPVACNDNMVCTTDTHNNMGTCTASCTNTTITVPMNGDGCCPSGANIGNDNDCAAGCGDGVKSPSETCDTAIPAGMAGTCPTLASCNDNMACTTDTLNSAGTCQDACGHTPITMPINGDGCCPTGANANNDNNCTPVCPNGVMESGEQCDDGNMNNGDACSNTCQTNIISTAFRFTDMDLREPHVFVSFIFCNDVTDNELAGFAVNSKLQDAITMDTDDPPDGLLDLSLVLIFRPLAQLAASTAMALSFPDCTSPMSSTSCTLNPPDMETPSTATNMQAGTCLGTLPNTLKNPPYSPNPVGITTAPCFVSDEETITIDLSGIPITLTGARVAAKYVGNPATGMSNGLVRGFISEADANNTVLPADLPLVGGMPLSSVLPGGQGCCAAHDDRDIGPDGVTMGWWFYLNFTATTVPYSAP
jgi:cysteine-rich repeat protein